jgi:hypothetical protein
MGFAPFQSKALRFTPTLILYLFLLNLSKKEPQPLAEVLSLLRPRSKREKKNNIVIPTIKNEYWNDIIVAESIKKIKTLRVMFICPLS